MRPVPLFLLSFSLEILAAKRGGLRQDKLGELVEFCDLPTLLLAGRMMSTNMCCVYNGSHLDRLNGWILAPNSFASFQRYDFSRGVCWEPSNLPLNVYFPMVFAVEHTCLAAIPVYSTRGTNDLISVKGYADLIVATQSRVIEVQFIYTQPFNDCTLQLTSLIMRDVQCLAFNMDESTTTDTLTTPTISTTSSTSSTAIKRSSFFDADRYKSIKETPGAGDSFNNPVLHQNNIKLCPKKFGRFRVVMTKARYRHAALVCLRKGLRLANLSRQDLGGAIGLVAACSGAGSTAWIGEYWRPTTKLNQCLELSAGVTAGTGGINIASSCSKLLPVLCEEPYFDLSL